MVVISGRSGEASIMPNDIRVKATTKCYCGNLGTKSRGRRRTSPECAKACFGYGGSVRPEDSIRVATYSSTAK